MPLPAQAVALEEVRTTDQSPANLQQSSGGLHIPLILPKIDEATIVPRDSRPEPDFSLTLKNMEFWRIVAWSALHDQARVTKIMPDSVKGAIVDLRWASDMVLGSADLRNKAPL